MLDLSWWARVFDSGTRTDGQWAEERRGHGGPIRVHGDGRQADLPWWAPVFDSGTWMGSQRAKERWGHGGPIRVHGDGRQALWRFQRKTATYPRKRKASATTSEGAKKDGLVGQQCPQAYRFDGLGHKTIAHLL